MGDDRFFSWGGTAVMSTVFGSATGMFLELAAAVPEEGDSSVIFHHGWTFLLADLAQLDVHGGAGLTDAAPDLFLGAGFSFRK